jgi:hypothetical protein
MVNPQLIFVEPPGDVDETWVHGAMLGGMTGYDDESLARSYCAAAAMLIESVLTSGERAQDLICPVLYLYRHGVELYLKVITRPSKLNHNIASLLDAFCRHAQEKYHETAPPWLTGPVRQLADFDPNSDLFRYGTTKDPSVSQTLTNSGELWVDLRSLRRIMTSVERAFHRVLVADREGLDGLRRLGRRAV